MYDKIIITANPSYATRKEANFWLHFDRVCEQEGWRLFKHSMRKIADDARTMILPARLSDVAGFIRNLPYPDTPDRLPEWLSEKNFATIVEWEKRRWQLTEADPRVPQGLTRLAWHVDHLFQTLRPAGTIVSNKIDHGTALFYWAAQHYGSKPIFFERSPLETFIVEDRGMFAESEIWTQYAAEIQDGQLRYLAQGQARMAYLSQNTDGFRPQKFADPSAAATLLHQTKGPKFFLPMDNTLWTGWAQDAHWQGVIDHYPGTPTPSAAINRIARIAAKHGGTVFLKKHPSDVQDYQITEPNVVTVDAPLEDLISQCDTCVCFLTKVAFVSTAMGKPTVTLAPNTIAASGATFHAEHPDDWDTAIEASLKASKADLEQRQQKLCNLLGWLDRRFYVDATLPADFDKPGAASLLNRIAASPAGQQAGLSLSALDQQIAGVMQRFTAKKDWLKQVQTRSAPLHLVFDVSRLANTKLRHSGISRFAHTMLSLLKDMPGVKVVPVLFKPDILKRGDYADNLPGFSDYLGAEVITADQVAVRLKGHQGVYFSPYEDLYDLAPLNLPRVATVHDVLHITSSEWYLDPKARTHIDTVLNSIGPDDMVVTVSEFTRMQLLRVKDIAPDRAVTVHLAAEDVFHPMPATKVKAFRKEMGLGDAPYFVLFGQFEFRKNVPTTLSAIRAVTMDPSSRAKFVVIGSAVGTDALRKALAASGLPADRIVFLSGPEDEMIATAYSGACGMLYVSLAEGFGLPVIEAMKCGCPTITSAVTSIPEVAGDGVLYVDPYSVKQIAEAILALEGSESLRKQLGRKALARSAQFTWKKTAEGILRVARDAASRDATAPRSRSTTSSTPELEQLTANFRALHAHAQKLEARLAAPAVPKLAESGDPLERLAASPAAEAGVLLLRSCASALLLDPVSGLNRLDTDPALAAAVARALAALPEGDALRGHFQRVQAHAEAQRKARPRTTETVGAAQ